MMSQKAAKMCKSPKNHHHHHHAAVIADYEHLSTNCTIVGSNNLHLLKKPTATPSTTIKPPPTTPQPTFPVMQLINPVMATRPMHHHHHHHHGGGGMFKLKPPLNILPKPAAGSAAQLAPSPPMPKASPTPHIQVHHTPQAAIMPQPLLLNAQMPMLAAAPGVRFILQPQTAKAAAGGLILQSAPGVGGQQLLQLHTTTPRAQPMVRVLTNGVGLPAATAFVAQMAPVTPSTSTSPPKKITTTKKLAATPPPKQKLDLANIMKLSGIGDEDDVLFEDVEPPEVEKKVAHIQATPAPPIVQLLNHHQTFQTTAAAAAPQTFSLAPSFAIGATSNGGLMALQRPAAAAPSAGGFKLAVGEDGRLVLQHDAAAADVQSQLLLQTIFGGGGSLIVQPATAADQSQIHSQTVQTIQQQSVQTIQQQTVQSQTIQTVQHQIVQPQAAATLQAIQSQIQSLLAAQQQQQPQITLQGLAIGQPNVGKTVTTCTPCAIATTTHNAVTTTSNSSNSVATSSGGGGASYFSSGQPVLKVQPFQKSIQPPVQTVHPLHHPPPPPQPATPAPSITQQQQQPPPPTSYVVNLTPEQLEQLKRNGQLTVNGQTIFMQRPAAAASTTNGKVESCQKITTSPKIKPMKKAPPAPVSRITPSKNNNNNNLEKTINSVAGGGAISKPSIIQPAAIVQPSLQTTTTTTKMMSTSSSNKVDEQTMPVCKAQVSPSSGGNDATTPTTTATPSSGQQQRVHTIQLTPAKQHHLKSIQLQIQTLSARMTPGSVDAQNALKQLFAEQQKILASGKLLPPDKVYYHNNQLIVSNSSMVKNEVLSPPLPSAAPTAPSVPPPPQQQPVAAKMAATPTTSSGGSVASPAIPLYARAQLIEQQMHTDQNGAIKPDVHTPFKDKADACKRLIRYHCFDQPVLSEKDLGKADEIFELTARHFIDKFGRMVDKYRYLLHKESQRHVQTSELMMLDRMFLSEEQQSIIKLRQEIDECNMQMMQQEQQQQLQQTATQVAPSTGDEYDEWACIQRELGCLPADGGVKRPMAAMMASGGIEVKKLRMTEKPTTTTTMTTTAASSTTTTTIQAAEATRFMLKSSASSQSARSSSEENDSIDEQVQSAIDSILNLQQNNLDLVDETMQNMLS